MRKWLRLASWASGAAWCLSWFVIYLEIFRWHHMTTSLRLHPPPQLSGFPPPRPGGFLLTAIATSIAAPMIFFVLLIVKRVGRIG